MRAGTYRPAIEPATLGYAIVRLGEAFLYNDAVAGMRGDVDRLREVQGAMFRAERTRDGEAGWPSPSSSTEIRHRARGLREPR